MHSLAELADRQVQNALICAALAINMRSITATQVRRFLRQAQLEASHAWKHLLGAPSPTGWSPAQCGASPMASTDGDQVIQRPGQVVLGGQDTLFTDAKMEDRAPRNRPVGRRGSQGACAEVLPRAGAAGRGGVNHPAPHGAVRADPGHDPHQLSLSPSAAFRQAGGGDGGPRARPAGLARLAAAGSATVQAVNPVVSAAAFATRRSACQLMRTQRHEQPAADGRAWLKEAGDIMVYLGVVATARPARARA
jgi:hypothetical protein